MMCAQFSGPPEVIEREVLALLQEMAEEAFARLAMWTLPFRTDARALEKRYYRRREP